MIGVTLNMLSAAYRHEISLVWRVVTLINVCISVGAHTRTPINSR